ncbi:MAG: hypothetical protein AAF371_06505 [Pseudomonadota bacterium]
MRLAWPESLPGTVAVFLSGFALMVGIGIVMLPGSVSHFWGPERPCQMASSQDLSIPTGCHTKDEMAAPARAHGYTDEEIEELLGSDVWG